MGKKKKNGGGVGGGAAGGGGQGGGGSNTSPSCPAPGPALCNTDDANTDLNTLSGAEVITGKGGKGGGKEGGAFVTAVLKVDFHCDGCAGQIRRSFKGCKGVEGVKMDRSANKVTVVGTMDPWKLQDRIQKKTKKKVEVISPAKKKDGGGDKQEAEKDDKKGDNKQVLAVNTVVMKVALHCDGCISRIRGVLMKIKGVEQVAIDGQKNQITVKGTMKTKGLTELLSKKIQRHVEVVVQKEKEKEKEKAKEEKKEEKSCVGQMTCHADLGWCHCDKCGYHVYMVPAPQLFSDDNPNSCAVM
ncbi:Heavy metal-associated isoprenylated plant protein 26 [Carex littledalei]|uniref:Heavy metal-associated isoprenylated plant protein 26 n=1 Tax=Carex littledalei TaxID=544730 RepID=A0A833VCQ1_9POAL|nr:Heavy metal-associated isoprenylated plant protein 26 [Carex littledalei]